MVYNLLGKNIATLCQERKNPGYHEISWNAEHKSSGIYLYSFEAIDISGNSFSDVKKCMLMK